VVVGALNPLERALAAVVGVGMDFLHLLAVGAPDRGLAGTGFEIEGTVRLRRARATSLALSAGGRSSPTAGIEAAVAPRSGPLPAWPRAEPAGLGSIGSCRLVGSSGSVGSCRSVGPPGTGGACLPIHSLAEPSADVIPEEVGHGTERHRERERYRAINEAEHRREDGQSGEHRTEPDHDPRPNHELVCGPSGVSLPPQVEVA